MKLDLVVNTTITIPATELDITASRSGGAGGQHVNKTSTRITVRWNVAKTTALTDEQKARVMARWAHRLTSEGEIVIHSSESRSQQQNKELALERLAQELRKALQVPKKRKPTKVTKSAKESRLQSKTQRSMVKKSRSKKIEYD